MGLVGPYNRLVVAEARTELLTATTLPSHDLVVQGSPSQDKLLQARAFRALARIDSKARPADARDELLAALKLSAETPEDTLLSAELAQAAGNGAANHRDEIYGQHLL